MRSAATEHAIAARGWPVTKKPASNAAALAMVRHELAQLRQQTRAARIDLARVQLDLLATQGRLLESHKAEQLLEANGYLIVAALRAQTEAEAANRELLALLQATKRDVLTGLLNRSSFIEHMVQALADLKGPDKGLALLFVEVNTFKRSNDTLGRAVSDEALIATALCIKDSVRQVDTVARYRDDQFLILLVNVSQRRHVLCVAEKISAALATPRVIDGSVQRFLASIGIGLYPDDGEDPQQLINAAYAAMCLARDAA